MQFDSATGLGLQLHPSRQNFLRGAGSEDQPWNLEESVQPRQGSGVGREPLGKRRDSAYQVGPSKDDGGARRHPPVPVPDFDFGSGQPLPPSRPRPQPPPRSHPPPPRPQGPPDPRRFTSAFQSLSRSDDPDLLRYLAQRRISPGFLVEIDLFLSHHPELLRYAPDFCRMFNGSSPREAYLFFVKGYTKPARYVRGVLPEAEQDIRVPVPLPSLCATRDPELTDFFSGYDYRYDILEKIDWEVAHLCEVLRTGSRLTRAQRLLIGYTLYGNPSDAYKYYEYNYQTEWLPHRYLPEHVILAEVPKADDYSEPIPRLLGPPESQTPENRRNFPQTRLRMARAMDAGVDVIDVLLEDFVAELARKGYRRTEIHDMKAKAQKVIGHQRDTAGGEDIVDLVMTMASERGIEEYDHDFKPPPRAPEQKVKWHRERLRAAKHSLERVYEQESHARRTIKECNDAFGDKEDRVWVRGADGKMTLVDLVQIVQRRRLLERRYVGELVGYGVNAGSLSKAEATDLQRRYSKNWQEDYERKGQELDLLGLYPRGI